MPDREPCETPLTTQQPSLSPTPRNGKTWAIMGFVAGATISIVFGVYSLQSQVAYRSSLPQHEQIACGMGGLAALMAMVIGVPLLGGIGAAIAFGLSKLRMRF